MTICVIEYGFYENKNKTLKPLEMYVNTYIENRQIDSISLLQVHQDRAQPALEHHQPGTESTIPATYLSCVSAGLLYCVDGG